MKNKALKYDEAVAAFHELVERTRAPPDQPDRSLSELRGTTWFLRNAHGPLAPVNHKGEVRTGDLGE